MSRSLGTLSIDLIARTAGFTQGMDKAGRESAKWRKQVEKDMQQAGRYAKTGLKTVAASALAAAAALTVMTKQGMALIDSQAKLARSLDTSFDSITALQLAAGDAGLDGLDGSLTRLNRRLGAAEVGSGAAAKAVKALNLDLQALSKMDAAERVATIADAIKDSGASSQRAARHLQDLGFEQREAVQFFAQGGDAIRAYTERVEALGLSLSDIDTAKVEAAGDAMGVFGDITRGVSQQLAVALSPILQQVASDFENAAFAGGGIGNKVQEGVDTAVKAVAFLADAADGVKRVFSLVADSIILVLNEVAATAALVAYKVVESLNAIPGVDMSSTLDSLREFGTTANGVVKEAAANMQRTLEEPLAGAKLLDYYEKAKVAAQDAAEESVRLGKTIGFAGDIAEEAGKKTSASADKSAESIAREITALERAAKTWGMGAGEVKIYDLRLQGASEAQLEYAKSLIDTVEQLDKQKKSQEDYLRLVQDLRTDEEKINDTLHVRLAILDEIGTATDQDYSRAAGAAFGDAPKFGGIAAEVGGPFGELAKIDDAKGELEEWYSTQLEMLEQFRSERADLNEHWDEQEAALTAEHNARQDEIERAREMAKLAAGEEFFGNLAGITKAFFGENNKLYMAAFAMEKAYAIGKALINVPKSYSDAYAATVGIPVIGPALAPVAGGVAAAAQVAQAAMIGNINLTGQAHDGIDSVPETGTWLLEKGERVTTAETSAKLDATLDSINRGSKSGGAGGTIVNIYEAANTGAEVTTTKNEQGREVIDIVLQNLLSDGELAGAVGRITGTQYQGV